MSSNQPKRLFIVDALAMAYRSFYALGRSSLSSAKGFPTGALLGTAMFLNKLLSEEKPDYLVFACDAGEQTFRQEIYAAYKAHRDTIPDDLAKQLPHFFRLLSCYQCPVITMENYEADDIIGSLCAQFSSPKTDIFIVSGDKDFMQLISDHVFMYSPKKGEINVIVDKNTVKEKFHCAPKQVIDCLALIGDTSDNVPGVSGIGDKGAAKLIEEFGSLDGIYANLDKISSPKLKENLKNQKKEAYLSKELVTIKSDLELNLKLSDLRCEPKASLTHPSLIAFYEEFGFRALLEKAKQQMDVGQVKSTDVARLVEKSADHYQEIQSEGELKDLLNKIAPDECLSFAVVTDGEDKMHSPPIGLAFSMHKITPNTSYYVSLKDKKESFLQLVEALVNHNHATKIAHDVKHFAHSFLNIKISINPPYIDTMICDYLIDPNSNKHTLYQCAERFLNQIKNSLLSTWEECAARSLITQKLYHLYKPTIADLGLEKVLIDIEMPLCFVLLAMERRGVFLDAGFLLEYSDDLDRLMTKVTKQIYDEAGEEFNIQSPKQLQAVLFDKLKIQDVVGVDRLKKTKSGLSTDESVLKRLSAHPMAKLILDYREVAKLKSTYVDTLPQHLNASTHRLHTNFHQTIAATGRLSSDGPNLQNIPMRSQMGQEIRRAFRPSEPDWLIISADYSQVEIRLLAALAKENLLIEAFKKDYDIHLLTAAKIFNVKPEEVTPTLRSRAKAVNFGIIYGMGPMRLAESTGVSMSEAKTFIAKYFDAFPGIKIYTNQLIEMARDLGYTTTITGRRRPIPSIKDSNRMLRARAENIAVNAPIQGSAADLIKIAMLNIETQFFKKKLATRLILQIHDELLFEGPAIEKTIAVDVIKDCMENAIKTEVPFSVEIGSGHNWLEAH